MSEVLLENAVLCHTFVFSYMLFPQFSSSTNAFSDCQEPSSLGVWEQGKDCLSRLCCPPGRFWEPCTASELQAVPLVSMALEFAGIITTMRVWRGGGTGGTQRHTSGAGMGPTRRKE